MREFFRDPSVRFGLKLGIAGVLVTYLALVLRLKEPTWALFTVFVLMVTPYVGTIMEKSVLRVFGTIIGAILGYLLLQWQQQPLIMLPAVVCVLAFCVAMFGQGMWAYGFFLCGLTLIDVMQAGLGDPQMSWRFALTRTEEVVLGILVALVVQSLVWPRYARVEFDKSLKEILGDLGGLLLSEEADALRQSRKLPLRVAKMRALIDFGAKESRDFRVWVGVFEEIADQVDLMVLSLASLSKPLPFSPQPHQELLSQMKALRTSLGHGFQSLGSGSLSDDELVQINHCRTRMEEALESSRRRGDFDAEDSPQLLSLGHHFQALIELFEALTSVRARFAMVGSGRRGGFCVTPARGPALPSRFWIRLGIKGGLAVVIALTLDNWLNPPGGDLLAISAWILLVRGPTAPAGRGDWRAFHGAILSILAWLLLGILLLWIYPFLASYGVMNIVLFSLLFLWGYIFYGRNPMSTPMLVGMLMIVGVFGLNAQKPVAFQDIADLSMGMALAILLSALIRRLIWPSLPQREILYRLDELSLLGNRVMADGTMGLSASERGRLALIPGEVATRLKHLRWPVMIDGEAERIDEYLQSLHSGITILSAAVGQIAKWPAEMQEESVGEIAASLVRELRSHLPLHGKPIGAHPTPGDSLMWFEEVFNSKLISLRDYCRAPSSRLSAVQWMDVIAFCKRMEEAAKALQNATRLSSLLEWPALKADSSL